MTRTTAPVWFALLLPALAPADDLAERIEAVTNGRDYKQAHWGILIAEAEAGTVLYEQNADRLFTPASVTKLYTCASALAALGPEFKFQTPVYARGEREGGRLKGDLILVASGDLTLGGRTEKGGRMLFTDSDHTYADATSTKNAVTDTDPLAGLDDLARQVAASGVRRVDGDVLIDDRLFPTARGSGSGPGTLTPIIVNDNVVDVIVEPGDAPGKPARVHVRPECALVRWDAEVETVAAGAGPFVTVESVGPQRFTVRGRVPLKSKPLVRIWEVDDPKAVARALFIEALGRAGVSVAASPLREPTAALPEKGAYDDRAKVATFTSPPLSEAVKVTLKVSHNLYASTLPLIVASRNGQTSIAAGLRWQRRFLMDLGVPADTISFAGGAGGMNADCTTPRATVRLLRAMRDRPEYDAWHAGFPVLGVDGTLVDAVAADSPVKGQVQAKTGTLSWGDAMNGRTLLRSKALAGTMTTASGKELVLVMFVNDVPLPPGVTPQREGRTLGRLCEIVFQNVK